MLRVIMNEMIYSYITKYIKNVILFTNYLQVSLLKIMLK